MRAREFIKKINENIKYPDSDSSSQIPELPDYDQYDPQADANDIFNFSDANSDEVVDQDGIIEVKHNKKTSTIEDYDPNGPPPGPEFKPTMPKGTVRVDVSDVYDWYKLGMHISDLKGLGKHDFGKGPPSTIFSFGDEDTEHKFIKNLEKTGLTTTDIDPIDPNPPKGMKRQKVDPTFNVAEAGPFSYGAKKPRQGSVAANAEQRRREQERGRQPIEPRDQRVGTAKVTKGVAEGLVDGVVVHNYTKMPIDLKPGQAQIHGWGPNEKPIYRVKGADGKEVITSDKRKMIIIAQGQGVAEAKLSDKGFIR